MAQQARRTNRRSSAPKEKLIGHGLREIVLIFFCFVALYLFVSLLTYYGGDPGWSHSGPVEEVRNKGGVAGALFADIFFYLFGYFAYLFPIMVGYSGWLIYQGRHHDILAEPRNLIIPSIGFILTLSAGCGLAIVHFMAESALLPTHAGGILGLWIGNGLVSIVDRLGATLILLALFFTGMTLLTGLSWLRLMDKLGYHTLLWLPVLERFFSQQFLPWLFEYSQQGLRVIKQLLRILLVKLITWSKFAYARWQVRRKEWRKERERYADYDDSDYEAEEDYFLNEKQQDNELASASPSIKPKTESPPLPEPEEIAATAFKIEPPTPPLLPVLDWLDPTPTKTSPTNFKNLSSRMEEAFATLQIEAIVNTIHPGPVLFGFEVQTITPINTNHLTELGEALAKVLQVTIRAVETQPGILTVEMPSPKRQTIYLSELLNSPEYQNNLSPLPVALGQDMSGQAVIVDLTRIPHILMAGSESAEKDLALHTLILSLLFKSPPSKVRLILVNNSAQVFSTYTDLPHLLTPIIADMQRTTHALQWCVQEMERRYRLMATLSVRNIDDYNQALLNPATLARLPEPDTQKPLFYVVVMISEIDELMKNSSGAQAEEAITRLTQKARAAGIHLILATQYPSVNVITGLLKANIPTRMAFRVTNKSESRTILGQMGAENLLGQGDMLYMTAGTGMPVRVHGSFISATEIHRVVSNLKQQAIPNYINLDVS
ncbi:DNA segregation ATPase FtsK [Thioploca ingrica]|uniref:DNA segregation ATPase FtsK n=1 Tax=Thioploca ingrica TaxID=40754 RepID=A0A090AGF3_9GAMM|nr:DNA segregation ATPase FtsK [Thioploca ingrica]